MTRFNLEDIKIFAFAKEDQQAVSEAGLIVAKKETRPHLILCEVVENAGFHVGKNIIPVCMKARDLFAPGFPLSDIGWHYFNGYGSSAFDFRMAGEWPLSISCENDWPFRDEHSRLSLNDYPQRVSDNLPSLDISSNMTATSVILPIDAGSGYLCMKWEEPDDRIYKYSKLHLVDTHKFAHEWLPQIERLDPELYQRFNSRGAQEHLIDAYVDRSPFDYPLEPPYINYDPGSERTFGFTNGNHRTLNLIFMGVPFIPMHITALNESLHKEFVQRFGWEKGRELTRDVHLGYSDFKLS